MFHVDLNSFIIRLYSTARIAGDMPPTPSLPRPSTSPKKSQPGVAAKKLVKKEKEVPAGGPDIRNFFSQGSTPGTARSSSTAVNGRGTGREPITIADSDDEEIKPETKPAPPKAVTSKHFSAPLAASSSVSDRAITIDSSPDPTPPPSKPKTKPSSSSSKMPEPKRKLVKDESDSEEDFKPLAKRQSLGSGRAAAKKPNYLESSDEEDEEVEVKPQPKSSTPKNKGKASKREASPMDVDDESDDDNFDDLDEDEDDRPKKTSAKKPPAKKVTPKKPAPKKSPAKRSTPKPAAKKNGTDEGDEKPKKPAVNFRALAAARAAGPKNPGSKEVPEGAPECLAGLTFVFTGELESLGREESQELAKRYGGKVTTAPSKKTSYVIVGENAGPSKVKKIKELGLE
ncbi:hypothetical protein BCR39DRAFT_188440, partial [Naematelia encephala]